MKSTVIFGALLLAGAMAIAQENARPSVAPRAEQSSKPLVVSGKVSPDGRTLITDIDSAWSVSNADVLKGHEGHLVRVKCYVNTAENKLRVVSVRRADSADYGSSHMDSAFRR